MARLTRQVAAVFACAAVVVLALAGVPAAAETRLPQAAPPDAAFVESLFDPLAGVFGKRPAPVSVRIGPGARARLSARAATVLPASYDLRALGRLSPVRNQGSLGTCWAFGNLAAVESRLLPGQKWDFSEDNLVTRSGYGPFSGGAYTWGGWDFMAVAYLARWAGPVTESDDPYVTPRPPRVNRVRKHVQGVVMLPGRTSPLDNDLLKLLVMQNGALSAGMFYDASFDSFVYATGERAAAYYCDLAAEELYNGIEVGENHGVDIVGWDDAYPAARFAAAAGRPPGDGAFLVRNSWGRSYGERGYFWVSYFDRSFAFGPCTSYSRVDGTGNYSHNYQFDTLGWTASMGYTEVADPSLAWGANRFVAKAAERVVAAGFYAPVAGTEYEVWAGASFTSLSRRAHGTQALPGFVTVAFEAPLAVRKGSAFVVAVRLVTPGVAQPMAVERPAAPWQSRAVARAGQSFMRYGDADPWVDLALDEQNPHANVCLKAYARR